MQPEQRAIVGVHGNHAVKPLMEQSAVYRQRRGHPRIAVDAEIRARTPQPLHGHVVGGFRPGKRIAAVGRIRRVGVLVRPAAGGFERSFRDLYEYQIFDGLQTGPFEPDTGYGFHRVVSGEKWFYGLVVSGREEASSRANQTKQLRPAIIGWLRELQDKVRVVRRQLALVDSIDVTRRNTAAVDSERMTLPPYPLHDFLIAGQAQHVQFALPRKFMRDSGPRGIDNDGIALVEFTASNQPPSQRLRVGLIFFIGPDIRHTLTCIVEGRIEQVLVFRLAPIRRESCRRRRCRARGR